MYIVFLIWTLNIIAYNTIFKKVHQDNPIIIFLHIFIFIDKKIYIYLATSHIKRLLVNQIWLYNRLNILAYIQD